MSGEIILGALGVLLDPVVFLEKQVVGMVLCMNYIYLNDNVLRIPGCCCTTYGFVTSRTDFCKGF